MTEPDPELHPSGMTEAEAWHEYGRYPSLLAKVALFGVLGGTAYAVFHSVESVLFPVLLALLIAYLLDPTVDWFEKRGWARTTAIGGILAIGMSGFTLLLLVLYPTVAHQVGSIADGIPRFIASIETDVVPWVEANTGFEVPATLSGAIASYGEMLQAQIPTLTGFVTSAAKSVVLRLGNVVASAVNIVMIPVFTFYFLRDFDHMKQWGVHYMPAANRGFVLDRIGRVDDVVGAWFRGQCEVAGILAALYGLGLGIVFGLSGIGASAGIAIGVLAGLLNIVPYFGFLIGFVLSVLMVLLNWSGVWALLGVLVVFGVVQALEGYVITPRIVGEKVGLSPVVVIIALLLGGELLGLVGILLALPIAGGLRVLLPDFVAYYRSTSWYTGKVDPAPRSFVEIAMEAQRAAEAAAPAAEAVAESADVHPVDAATADLAAGAPAAGPAKQAPQPSETSPSAVDADAPSD